ncbi:MAG: ABC transporter substrate-binding protein, partial [Candidatus Cybelea sp.]
LFQASMQTYPVLHALPDVKLVWVNVNGYEAIQLNCSHDFLKDPLVRRAISYGIDRYFVVHALTFDTQTIASEDIPSWMWAFNPNVPVFSHEPGKAHDLLIQAGWRPGPDGIMQKNGERLSLVLVTNNSNVTRRREALLIQGFLNSIGIDVSIKSYPGDVLFAPAGMGGILQQGKYDMSLAGWYAGIDPDDSSQFMCRNFPPGGYNYSRYCSPQMEALQHIALTHYDRPTRRAAYFRIQELLARDNPELFDYYYKQMEPISVDFKGFDPNPVVESWNAWQWSI